MSTKTRQLALAGCLVAVLAAGCGSDEEGAPIPQQQVADLEARLGEVERRMAAGGGACEDIQNDSLPAVQQILDQVPDRVDADVRDALRESLDRLFELTTSQCEAAEPEPEPEPETETETTPTEPTETETIPTEPEQTETEEEEKPKEKKDGNGDNGGGGGNGGGNGGGAPAPGIGG